MTVDISELANSASTDGSSNDSDNNDNGVDELKAACDAIDANLESAKEYVDNHGNKDDLIGFAERLADDDELWATQEEYRRKLDVHRIRQNYLYSVDGEFTKWGAAFYGNSDNPDPSADTYNGIQAKSRNMDGNLAFYKALFPAPAEQFWDQEPVLWEERPNDDAHIYVTQEFVSEYSGFTLDDGRPRPPTDEELANMNTDNTGSSGSSGGSGVPDPPFLPSTRTVDGVKNTIDQNDYTVDELRALLTSEKAEDNRKTAKEVIRRAIDNAEEAADTASSDANDEETPAMIAGRLVAETGTDTHPEAIAGMVRGGMSEAEIREYL